MREVDDGASLPRVVILGGGVAGMTTAFELSQPGWRDQYSSITVYQYGWRLGGKGASGRGAHGRIEEHGLHIWLGFYDNAFRMMRECYEELGRDPSSPIARVEDAFERSSLFIVQEPRGDSWLPWMASFPETDAMPGDRDALPSLWLCMVNSLRLALAFLKDAKAEPAPPGSPVAPGVSLRSTSRAYTDPRIAIAPKARSAAARLVTDVRGLWSKLYSLVSDVSNSALAAATLLAEHMPDDPSDHDPADHHRLRGLIERGIEKHRRLRVEPDELPDAARRQWYLADVMLAAIRGVLHDGVLLHPDGLDAIDGYDFSEWLIRHGANPQSANCSMVTTLMYDLPFSYRDGDPKQPSNGAGTALRGAIRTFFTHTGAIAWKMRAGMGDIVFAPMWEVLQKRGVQFEFFHRVDALHLSDDGSRISSIDLSRQVRLRDPSQGYQPLVDVQGLPCWPNAPLTDQLDGDAVTAEDLESFWSRLEPAEQYSLHDGRDFDTVVLAIPVGAHPYICPELVDHNPRWKEMVDNIGTIYTQAFQLWLNVGMDELGCDWPQATMGGYLEPFDTVADMRQLIERETWEPGAVGAIAYFCNAMPTPPGVPRRDDYDLPARAAAEVKANALSFVRDAMLPLWPRGVRRYPTEFRWELLVDDDERTGPSRFDSQFWRANVDPSERYVLSLPDTSQYRLAPGASGYDNLVLAGDWTKCALNSGCVEAAVISGLLAAAATQRKPPRRTIIGCAGEGGQHVW